MPEALQSIGDTLRNYAVEVIIAGLFTAVGWYLGKRRARAKWERKEFLDRLNISLNRIEDGTLKIRTLIEKHCEEVFLNSLASAKVVAAARQTTAADPLLPLPKDDYWYYLNAVLNEMAEKFAIGQVKRDLGLPTQSSTYVICLTCESAGPIRTRKVRAMVIRRDLLLKLPETAPQFESPTHVTRWDTLQKLAAAYTATPHRFLDVEVCL